MSAQSSPLRTALALGTAAAGTYAGLRAACWWQQRRLLPPALLPPAYDWASRTIETRAGRAHCYVRPGTGPPLVLLHSVNATASSAEMKPLAEHLADTTDRPIYAPDWIGFGRSARPDRAYTPAVFARQLYDLLETLGAPADLVALSLGCEYAAWVGLRAAPAVRRLVLVSPTGLTAPRGLTGAKRLALRAAAQTGVFELLFYRLTRRAALRRFYERQVFPDAPVPDALVDYAATTARAKGAHRAPRRFLEGRLFVENVADTVYSRLYRPTLLLTPTRPGPTIQSFDRLPAVLDANPRALTHRTLPGGLMPHWDQPAAVFEALDAFLDAE
jgi:pimeloyl-ACP methyl ester carboxylesterase